MRPGEAPFTERTPRVAAARALLRRQGRERAGRFLAEGPQAVGEAVGWARDRGGGLLELFVTERAGTRHHELVDAAVTVGARVSPVTERASAGLSDTATPQGLVAVCSALPVPASRAAAGTRLVAVLAGVAEPGNAGTVIRVADAAGADAVILAGHSVDPHNGKCVRASVGSVFHLPLAVEPDGRRAVDACRDAGLHVLAADGATGRDLDEAACAGVLDRPTAWLFGSEAHGLGPELLDAADAAVAVPLHGRAESLNLATAAAVCLYASARAHRSRPAATWPEPIA
ncbi:MAG: RNA methyltransferase [Pseudonocardiaceae bacterium]|nr:RNA methyltransferase [Pseudonocardiaceae bacterium]